MMRTATEKLETAINWQAIADQIAKEGQLSFCTYGAFVERLHTNGPAYTEENAHYHITDDIDEALRAVAARHGLTVDYGNRQPDEAIIMREA
jgi:hypothetical protein